MFHKKSQGNVIIVVLFVIIVMGFLAASLMRVSWSNQSTLTREFLGTKAWFIAQSANEWALTKLFPLNATSSTVSTLCASAVNGQTPNVGQGSCQLNALTCSNVGTFNQGTADEESLFKVQATVICGSGVTKVQRQQEVWVREYNR